MRLLAEAQLAQVCDLVPDPKLLELKARPQRPRRAIERIFAHEFFGNSRLGLLEQNLTYLREELPVKLLGLTN